MTLHPAALLVPEVVAFLPQAQNDEYFCPFLTFFDAGLRQLSVLLQVLVAQETVDTRFRIVACSTAITQLVTNTRHVLRLAASVHRGSALRLAMDQEMYADIVLRLVEFYCESEDRPRMLVYLQLLQAFQASKEKFVESAGCLLRMADCFYLTMEETRRKKQALQLQRKRLAETGEGGAGTASPFVDASLSSPSSSSSERTPSSSYSPLVRGPAFSSVLQISRVLADTLAEEKKWFKKYSRALVCASEMFEQDEYFELSINILHVLEKLFIARKMLEHVVDTQRRILSVYERLYDATARFGDVRTLGTYYRVGFYGKRFGPLLDGTEYVYREPKLTQLTQLNSRLCEFYSDTLGVSVTAFKDSGRVDREKMDPFVCKIQITKVEEMHGEGEGDEDAESGGDTGNGEGSASASSSSSTPPGDGNGRLKMGTIFPPSFRLTRFRFDTPVIRSGEGTCTPGHTPHIHEQFKRRTELVVEHPLPFVVSRSRVVEKRETDISPLQCVIEDIRKRIRQLGKEALPVSGEPSLKTLGQVLSGCVNMQVHGGTKEVAETFLAIGNPVSVDNEKDVKALKAELAKFLKMAGKALEVAKGLCESPAEVAFVQVLSKGYQTLNAEIPRIIALHDEWSLELRRQQEEVWHGRRTRQTIEERRVSFRRIAEM